MILGINASRSRSGGARAHLTGTLSVLNPTEYGIVKIHVWSYKELLDSLPDVDWLIKHAVPATEKSLLHQLFWERFILPRELDKARCSMLLNTDAGSICRSKPSVTMSRDLLCYEPGEMARYGFTKAGLRLFALRFVQNAALRNSDGAVFLTDYAKQLIEKSCGKLKNSTHIPHGVESSFQMVKNNPDWDVASRQRVNCVYVSNAELYKHQWHVIKAIEKLRKKIPNIKLILIGGGSGKPQKLVEETLRTADPRREYIVQHEFVPHNTLPGYLAQADIFIFASSCEAFGITLLEGMSAGLPIACSNRSSLQETLKEGGVYFDPENPDDISKAVYQLITDVDKRKFVAKTAAQLSTEYSWERCSSELFSFIRNVFVRHK